MKANELRIGNYVDFDGFVWAVKSISDKVIEAGDSFARCDVRFLKPVSLTKKWFLRFGFKRGSTKHSFCMDGFPSLISYDKGKTWEHDEENFGCGLGFTLSFVHQIQNLHFALTGEELTIK